MFKEERRIWLYLIGIVLMFGLFILFGINVFLPLINGQRTLQIISNPPKFTIDTNLDYLAKLNTNKGQITVNLFEKNAPKNVNNFIYLSNGGYYNSTKFHRLIPNFLIQGGDRNTLNNDLSDDGKGKPGYLIEDEINWDSLDFNEEKRRSLTTLGYKNTPNIESKALMSYTIAMANAGADTNGSQFFIVLAAPNDPRLVELNGRYTVIGEVEIGKDILEEMNRTPVNDPNSNSPRPANDIILESVEITTR